MDRNLGASQVATSYDDAAAYGDLFQWGRGADGHQIHNPSPATTSTLSFIDAPGHGDFITTSSSPYDWRVPQNDTLWQGVSGTNNPCPAGFRLPTKIEIETEILSWSSQNAEGAFASPLKFAVAGYRSRTSSTLYNVGIRGSYWSSTVWGSNSRYLYFHSGDANGYSISNRAYGRSVRCLED